MRRLIEVVEDPAELAERAAALVAGWAAGAAAPFRVALSGGSTPRAFYEVLACEHARRIPWRRLEFFWGDERCAPPEEAGSNHALAREALLKPLRISPSRIHRIRAELPAAEAAARYDADLRRAFALGEGELPRFDLALMGLGQDGHTASLFPGSPVFFDKRLAREVLLGPVARVTLTLPVFNNAARVLFVVSGAPKAAAAKAALEGSEPPLPAALVRPVNGELVWLLDAAAASALS